MEYLSIIGTIIKLLLILSATGLTIILIIALFHPLTFNVKLRASQLGQRADIWASYLFGLLKVGVIATPHTQDVTLKILFWKKMLQRHQRIRPPRPTRPDSHKTDATPPVEHAAFATPTVEKTEVPAAKEPEPKSSVESKSVTPPPDQLKSQSSPAEKLKKDIPEQPILPPVDKTKAASYQDSSTSSDTPVTKVEIPQSQTPNQLESAPLPSEPEDVTPTTVQTPTPSPIPAEVDTKPLKSLDAVTAEQTSADSDVSEKIVHPADKKAEPKDESWRAKARRFRRDLSNRYRQLKNYIKLFMRKWQILSPILWRFWARGKKGFNFSEPCLKVRYALHEPYITGMFHATMSMLAGVVGQFGICFIPTPVFSEPCLYARGQVTAVIRPWRLAAAMLGLIFERDLYRELWQAFKWYRASRQR